MQGWPFINLKMKLGPLSIKKWDAGEKNGEIGQFLAELVGSPVKFHFLRYPTILMERLDWSLAKVAFRILWILVHPHHMPTTDQIDIECQMKK